MSLSTNASIATRRLLAFMAFVAGAMVLSQATASARHNFSMLEVADQEVTAGEEVRVSGFSYTDTVNVRFGEVDGPVLATLEPSDEDIISGMVTIPEEASPGRYVLFAVQQDEEGNLSRIPGQAMLTVAAIGGAPLDPTGSELEVRPTTLLVADRFSLSTFLAITLATVAVMGVLAMVAYSFAARRTQLEGSRS